MIIIGIGANLPSKLGSPYETCKEAIRKINSEECKVTKIGKWYKTSPVPNTNAPWYVNTVIAVDTKLSSEQLLDHLHNIEDELGRARDRFNSPRNIDLDLIDYKGEIRSGKVVLPHPRMHLRAFVLLPLKDITDKWIHPITGRDIGTLISRLPDNQLIKHMNVSENIL